MIPKVLQVPSTYSPSLAQCLCEQVASGMSLAAACRLPGFPGASTAYQWRRDYPEFAEALDIANQIRGDVVIDEASVIADDSSQDWQEVTRKDGRVEIVLNNEHVQRSKIRVDLRKWTAARLSRRQWGDNKSVDLTATVSISNLTDEELQKRLDAANAVIIEHESKMK